MGHMAKSASASFRVGWVPTTVCSAHLMLLGAGAVVLFQSSRPRPGLVYLAVLGLGALTIALVPWLGTKQLQRNWAGWALAALLAGAFASVLATSGHPRLALLALSELAVGCALNAIGVTSMLRPVEWNPGRLSPRIVAASAVGGLGLVMALPSTLRGPAGSCFPTLLAFSSVFALGLGAFKLEPLAHGGPPDRAAATTRRLLGGTWLGMAAIMVASQAGGTAGLLAASGPDNASRAAWGAAAVAGRLGWLQALPLAGMSLVVFALRAELAGIATLSAKGNWLGFAGAALLSGAGGRRTLALERARAAAEPNPVAGATPPASAQMAADPVPATGSASGANGQPSASNRAPPPADPPEGASRLVRVESVAVEGVPEPEVGATIERRRQLLEDCARAGADAGTLAIEIVVSAGGGASRVAPVGGELAATPLAQCMTLAFYHMGFPPPVAKPAKLVVKLRIAPGR